MFRPAKMAKIDLQIPQEYMAKTTSIIADLRRLHVMNIRKTRVGELDLESHTDGNLLRKYIELRGRLQRIFKALDIPSDRSKEERSREIVDPYEEMLHLDQRIQELEKDVIGLVDAVEIPRKGGEEKQNLLYQMEMFSQTKVDLKQFHECKFLYVAAGLIPGDNLERLELSLSNTYHLIIPFTSIGKRRLVFVFSSRKDQEKIEKALKSAYFEKIQIPEQEGSYDYSIEILRGQIQEMSMEKSVAQDKLERSRKELDQELIALDRKVRHSIAILEIEKFFDKVGNTYHICGWVPEEVIPTIEKEVQEATNNQARVSISFPNQGKEKRGELFKIPTCFQNPFLLKPFEKLVSEYGIPSYGEVEPTFLFALSFLFMFGVMFGDVGHGLTLFLAGFLGFKKSTRENIRDIALIIMECGTMSTIFGFLYGSIFGFEHVLPALWFNPMENISYFMKVTVGFGIIIISMGLILNIINSISNNDYKKGIFGEFGIMGLIFYWGCIGLVITYLTTGKMMIHFSYIMLILFLPLMVIFLKEPLFNLYGRIILNKKGPLFPDHLGIYLMESLIEVGDTVIGFLSNTVSFIRVSAFALAHAGLFLAVFALANTLQDLKGGMLWYWLIMVLGNIAIIVIEGVVVSIQTIRLEYYEFFSKFFKGGGEIYRPLKI